MPFEFTSTDAGAFRFCARVFWLALALVLLCHSAVLARDLVLGFVPDKCQLLSNVEQAEKLADYLSSSLERPVRVRVFTDERNLHHWMNRFREIDLAVFSRSYLDKNGKGRFIPLAEYIDSGSRHHGGGLLVGRQGLSAAVFVNVKQRLLSAAGQQEAKTLLDTLRIVSFVKLRHAGTRKRRVSPGPTAPQSAKILAPASELPGAGREIKDQPEVPATDITLRVLSPQDGGTTGPRPLLLFDTPAREVHVSLDGSPVEARSGSRLGPLRDGEHTIKLTSPSFAGDVRTSFRVDATPPVVIAELPQAPVSGAQLSITGIREKDARVRLLDENGQEAAEFSYPDRTHWQIELKNLVEGENRYSLVGRDGYGNQVRLPVLIVRDSLPPNLVVTSPQRDAVLNQPPGLEFQSDSDDVRFWLNDQPVKHPAQALAALGDGVHRIRIEARDAAGNLTTVDINFTLDRSSPEFEVDAFPGLLVHRRLQLMGHVAVDSRLALTLEPETLVASLNFPEEGRWQLQLDNLVEGENFITLRATDAAGNVSEKRLVIRVDLTPPVLQVLSPAEGAILRETPSLKVETEGHPWHVQLDGKPITPDSDGSLPELDEGEHLLRIEARDPAGNVSTVTRKFVIDRRAPQLQLLSPRSGLLKYSNPRLKYRGEAGDIEVILDGKPLRAVQGEFIGPLVDGEHKLTLTAVDAAGNRRQLESVFTIDTRPPDWAIVSGAEPGNTSERVLKGRIEAESKIQLISETIRVESVDYPSEGQWQARVSGLQPGENTLRVIVEDLAGNTSISSLTLVRDDQAPELTVRSPQAGEVYTVPPQLDFTTTEGVVSIRLDAQLISLTTGDQLPELADGEHVLLLQAIDAAGNETARAVRFSIDRQAPELTVDPIVAAVNSDKLKISGKREAGVPVVLADRNGKLDCELAYPTETSWSCDFTDLPEGRLQLTLSASDKAGNLSHRTLEVLIDRTPPVLDWISPLPGSYARLEGFEYRLNEGSLKILIDGVPFAPGDEFKLQDLSAGAHRIEVTALDAAGNRAEKIVELSIDQQAPQITIQSPPELNGVTRPLLEFSVDEGRSEVYLDGKKIVTGPGEQLPPLGDGQHLLRVEARDAAGNLGFAEKRFRVDTVMPVLELIRQPGPVSADEITLEGQTSSGATLTAEFKNRPLEIELLTGNRFRVVVSGLSEGVNRVTLQARGANGLQARLPLQLVRDTRPLVLELQQPLNKTYATPTPAFKYAANRPPARIEVSVDGAPVKPGPELQLGPFIDGVHQVHLRAWDLAGNSAEVERTFSVDTTAAEFTIQSDPRPTSAERLTLRGTREKGALLDLVAPPGVQVSPARYPAENSWEIDLAGLPEGDVPLALTARDQVGNAGLQEFTLHVDRTAPELLVSSPRPGPGNNPLPELRVSGEDGALAVLLNGQPILAEVNQLGPLADGKYILLVRKQDLAGNQNQQRIAFQVDTHAPEVSISSPTPGARTSAYPIVEYGVDEGQARVLLDGQPVAVESGTSLHRLEDGSHRLQVIARDAAGNEGQAEVEFLVDGSAPEVVLLSPASGLTPDDTPLLEYQVDRGEVRVLVDDKVVNKRSGMSLDPLEEGEHLIRVESWDETGNVGFAERRLVISTARPQPAQQDDFAETFAEFKVSLSPAVVTHRHEGLLTLTIGPLHRSGSTLFLEQWIDANGNGVADSGEQIVRVFKLIDGLASPSPRVPGDTDGKADRMITTRLSLDQLHDGSSGPVQYVLLAMGDSNVGETVFRVVPEP